MPLDDSVLAGNMKTAIEAAYGRPAEDPVLLQKFCDAVSQSVINHIIANMTITLAPGDVPVQVSISTGTGANTAGAPLTGKVS